MFVASNLSCQEQLSRCRITKTCNQERYTTNESDKEDVFKLHKFMLRRYQSTPYKVFILQPPRHYGYSKLPWPW